MTSLLVMRCWSVSLLLSLAAVAQIERVTSRHYEVVSGLGRARTMEIAAHMDSVYDEYEDWFASFVSPVDARVYLHLHETNRDYQRFVSSKGFPGPNTDGMFIWFNNDAYLTTYDEGLSERAMISVLQHEGFHQFSYLHISRRLPAWVDEGLAEYFGAGHLVNGSLITGIVPPWRLRSLQDAIDRDEYLPFRELLAMPTSIWGSRVVRGDPKSQHMYAQAWSLVHFLIHAEDGRYRPMLDEYLTLISRGRTARRAYAEAFGTRDITSLEEPWKAYVRSLEPDDLSKAAQQLQLIAHALVQDYARGVSITTLDQLEQAMRHRRIQAMPGAPILTGGELLTPPGEGSLLFTPGDDGRPPSLEMTGLRARVVLEWTIEDGEPAPRVSYR